MDKNSKEILCYIYIIRSMNDDDFFLILKSLVASPDNRMLEIIEEDVHATLALPMGSLEVHAASAYEQKNKYTKLLEVRRRRWNLGRTETQKVGMMVEQILEETVEKNSKEILCYIYILRSTDDNCFFIILKSLAEITDAVEQKNKDKKKFLEEHIKEKQGPIVSDSKHRTTDVVEQKNKDKKKFLGEHGRG
ncbi:LOW QUALITY PROTEIN: hypothetical protein Cgig2_002770 [Carnegiea gigantea]|uniref:Uncharacterized protein n=1 Tax=Carnegiea gigantea TaxID=171969 RepID=A0A9Q1JJX3_9CARY|nr:LOW QUALITY PROTEIN: hypothetical protein Cgig2_002770 [Carnegiea gigantea]